MGRELAKSDFDLRAGRPVVQDLNPSIKVSIRVEASAVDGTTAAADVPEARKVTQEVLPPELLPGIADALGRPWKKRTLAKLIRVSRRTYDMCFPIYMRSLALTIIGPGFKTRELQSLALALRRPENFRHTKSLRFDVNGNDWNFVYPALCQGLLNLESLEISAVCRYPQSTLAHVWNTFLKGPSQPPLLHELKLGVPISDLDSMFRSADFALPESLTAMKIGLNFGTPAVHRRLFGMLERLPLLDRLDLDISYYSGSDVYRTIFDFPKLLLLLRKVEIRWPCGTEFLVPRYPIERLQLIAPSTDPRHAQQLWPLLRPMKTLRKFVFYPQYHTSILIGISSVPQIKEVTIFGGGPKPMWDLTDNARKEMASLKDLRIRFIFMGSSALAFNADYRARAEVSFWKSLPGVTIEEVKR
jgi:hypothetical protein